MNTLDKVEIDDDGVSEKIARNYPQINFFYQSFILYNSHCTTLLRNLFEKAVGKNADKDF